MEQAKPQGFQMSHAMQRFMGDMDWCAGTLRIIPDQNKFTFTSEDNTTWIAYQEIQGRSFITFKGDNQVWQELEDTPTGEGKLFVQLQNHGFKAKIKLVQGTLL